MRRFVKTTATMYYLFFDEQKDLYYIGEQKISEPVKTFEGNPIKDFKRIQCDNFGGTMYQFGMQFIAINYPNRPKFCRWVLFRKKEKQKLSEVIDFICELDDAGSFSGITY